jgi:hypothetical protein
VVDPDVSEPLLQATDKLLRVLAHRDVHPEP